MIHSYAREQIVELKTQLFRNHPALYSSNMNYIFGYLVDLEEEAAILRTRSEELQRRIDQLERNKS